MFFCLGQSVEDLAGVFCGRSCNFLKWCLCVRKLCGVRVNLGTLCLVVGFGGWGGGGWGRLSIKRPVVLGQVKGKNLSRLRRDFSELEKRLIKTSIFPDCERDPELRPHTGAWSAK